MNDAGVTVSIVVACRNESGHVEEFLASVLQQDLRETWEVIVADGMSTDGTRDILNRYAASNARLRIIDNPGRIVSTGLNAAIREARGKVIIRMDMHTTYAPDYATQCVKHLRATGADNVGGPARTISSSYAHRAIAAAYHSPFSCGGARFHNPDYEGEVDTVAYGCWDKVTLERLGMFDEQLVRNQDDELNLRISRAGGRIWQSPEIRSWYHPRARLSSLFRQYFQYGFWKVLVIRKHKLPASWRHLIPGTFVLANLVLGLACLTSLFGYASLGRTAGLAWIAMLSAYFTVSVAASIQAARRHGWALLPSLPWVFATYHVSYGLGFLAGVLYWSLSGQRGTRNREGVFTEITR